MITFGVLAAGLLSLASCTTAHLILQQPVPYGIELLDNSPMVNAAPGSPDSNFPCKLKPNQYSVSVENHITVGESNEMKWTGSASHGGGTCQLSVTRDRMPTANSTFKVIASWIGGCTTDPSGASGTIPFKWTMPAEVMNGKATLAWNWVSKESGQPENYMNCAPITVTGGADNEDEFNQLEDLFLVNLPSTNCGSQLSSNLQIPNPGKYVTTVISTDLMTPTGTGCAALGQASATEAASTGANSSVTSSPVSAYTPETTSSAVLGASVPSNTNSVVNLPFPSVTVVTVPSPAPSAAATSSSYSYSYDPLPSSTSATGSSPSGSSGSGDTTCSTNGAVVCNGTDQFGICNFGSVVWQDVAAGTTCSNGQIVRKRDMDVLRHARHPHRRWSF